MHAAILSILLLLTFPATGQTVHWLNEEHDRVEDVLQAFPGKVIYVDFWASWCRPCLASMPASKVLQDSLRNEPVVFLFLGYNDKQEAWQQAIETHELRGYHYWLSPEETARIRRQFAIVAIPHYAIIGPDGEIAYLQTLEPDYPGLKADLRALYPSTPK